MIVRLPLFALLIVFFAVCSAQVPPYASTLVLAGGEVDDNNTAVYGPMVRAAGGNNARIAVVTAASYDGCCDPDSSWVLYNSIFSTYSPADISWVPIDVNHTHNNANATVLKQLAAASLIFFSGGDQTRVVASFFNDDHVVSPALNLIRNKFFGTAPGFAVAGSSAGTACQPASVMIADGLSYSALVNGSIPRQSDGEDNLLCVTVTYVLALPSSRPPTGTIQRAESVCFRILSTRTTRNAAARGASSACFQTRFDKRTARRLAWPLIKTLQRYTRRRLQLSLSPEEPAARACGFTMWALPMPQILRRDGRFPTCWFLMLRMATA